MHAEEIPINEDIVRQLLADQFPRWASLPLVRVPSSGTVNAIFRLGTALAVRAPFVPGDAGILREAEWSPRLAPHLPVRVPRVLGVGEPGAGYPSPWLVVDWIPGENPEPGALRDPERVAGRVASFIEALRSVEPSEGAPAAHRHGDLADHDTGVRDALSQLEDADELTTLWDEALAVPPWRDPPVWVHGDLLPSNVLVDPAGDLIAVIDMVPGVADPATELIVAWALLPAEVRPGFRAALDVDDDTWARGRGWAVLQAAVALPYYRDINPGMARIARHTLGELLRDQQQRRWRDTGDVR